LKLEGAPVVRAGDFDEEGFDEIPLDDETFERLLEEEMEENGDFDCSSEEETNDAESKSCSFPSTNSS